jgi:hypothetical protein
MNVTLRTSVHLNREEKWLEFLSSDPIGKAVFHDILQDYPNWKTQRNVASEIAGIYDFSCLSGETNPHSTAENDGFIHVSLRRMQMEAKALSVTIRLAKAVGLDSV